MILRIGSPGALAFKSVRTYITLREPGAAVTATSETLEPHPSVGCWFSDQTLSVFTMTTAESHHQPGQDHVNGVASFDLVHHHRADDRIFLYAFDLIELNGNDLAGGSAR